MSTPPIYIARQSAEDFQTEFAKALEQPASHPLLFHVWGIGGVGKTTLLHKLQEDHRQAKFSRVYFGRTEGIETPLKLMATLYQQLPKPALPNILMGREPDPFISLFEQYHTTAERLQSQSVDGKAEVDTEQRTLVKELLSAGVLAYGALLMATVDPFSAMGLAAPALAQGSMGAVTATKLVSMQQLLQQHPSTRNNQQLQTLMLEPIPRLTQAFVQALIQVQHRQQQPVILILDTYEKNSNADLDLWLCKYLLANIDLQAYPIRIVVAGRNSLLAAEHWRKLNQDCPNCLYEGHLERFDREETVAYLQQIGITEPNEVENIYQATKGLPYYLNWIRQEQAKRRSLDFSRGNQEVVNLLLQGLNTIQKQVVQLAACCRWFDRSLIEYLMTQQGMDFQTAPGNDLNCFDWLKQQDFVELAQNHYRLDDVARDVFRQSLRHDDEDKFYYTHGLLADYFKQRAARKQSADSSPSEQYGNPEWCKDTAESLYHGFFAGHNDIKLKFISHLLASVYLNSSEIVDIPFNAITAEWDLADHPLLSESTRKLLSTIKPAVEWSWLVFNKNIREYIEISKGAKQPRFRIYKSEAEAALQVCFSQIPALEGLAKFAAMFYKSKRGSDNERLAWLQQAKAQAEKIATPWDYEFSCRIFENVGIAFSELGSYEETIASFDKAIEIKSDDHYAWHNYGNVLFSLGRYEDALTRYEKAIEFNPDFAETWRHKGSTMLRLSRYEEAITSYDKAIELQPDFAENWRYKGGAMFGLGRYKEAITSFDKAIELQPDFAKTWAWKGGAMFSLSRYEEAIISYNKALELQPDFAETWVYKGVAMFSLGRYEEAITSYDRAIEFKPDFAEAWAYKGISMFSLSRYEEAIISFDKAIEFKSDFSEALYRRGVALFLLGRYEEGSISAEKALEFNPNLLQELSQSLSNSEKIANLKKGWELLPILFQNLWQSGRYTEIISIAKVLEFLPNLLPDFSQSGLSEETIANYEQAIELAPDNFQGWLGRGSILIGLDRYEEALTSFDKALEFQPNFYFAWILRASSLQELARYDEAIASIDKALEMKPDDALAYYSKACCYALQGDAQPAVDNLQQAVNLGGNEYLEEAKTDSDFDNIRSDERFQALLQTGII